MYTVWPIICSVGGLARSYKEEWGAMGMIQAVDHFKSMGLAKRFCGVLQHSGLYTDSQHMPCRLPGTAGRLFEKNLSLKICVLLLLPVKQLDCPLAIHHPPSTVFCCIWLCTTACNSSSSSI